MWRHIIATSTCCSILVFFLEASHSSRSGRQSGVLDGSWVRRSLCLYFYKFGPANRRGAAVSRASDRKRCPGFERCPGEQVGEGFSRESSTPPKTQFWQVMMVPTTRSSARATPPTACTPRQQVWEVEVLVTGRRMPSSHTTALPRSSILVRRSVPVTHIPTAPPTAHRADLGHQRISLHLPPSLLWPRQQWEDVKPSC